MISESQLTIDPKMYPKYKSYLTFMVLFWVIWAPVTGLATYLAITKQEIFFYVWLIFGYLGTFLIPWSLLCRNRKMTITLGDGKIEVKGAGFKPNSLITFNKDQLLQLTLEHYDEDDSESVYSLNILYTKNGQKKRIHLVPYINPKSLDEIFYNLSNFLIEHKCKFKQKNNYN